MWLLLSCFSCVQLFVTSWTVARQAPLSMQFSRQQDCRGLPLLLQGIFLTQDQTWVSSNSCTAGSSLPLSHWGSPQMWFTGCKIHFLSKGSLRHYTEGYYGHRSNQSKVEIQCKSSQPGQEAQRWDVDRGHSSSGPTWETHRSLNFLLCI